MFDKDSLPAPVKRRMLADTFFTRQPQALAKMLLGKVIRVRHQNLWLSALIIETEAYFLQDKASHASLGFSEKRKALFMAPGTIYMYHARGGDSLNISALGSGNAVLIKSGFAYLFPTDSPENLKVMQHLNPHKYRREYRLPERLCSGQTLLCTSLGLKVRQWDQKSFDRERFYIADIGYVVKKIVQAKRLGIPTGRDEHSLYRFIDYRYINYATGNPMRKRHWERGRDYIIIPSG